MYALETSTISCFFFLLFFSKILGVATLGSLKAKMLRGNVQKHEPVMAATYITFKKVTLDTTLEKLDRILDKEHFALVVHSQRLCKYIL
jgi:cystathionine beta-synthase